MSGWELKNIGDVLKLEYGKPLPKENRDEEGVYVAYGANGIKCRTNDYYWDKPSIIVGRKGSAGEINLTEEKFWPLDVTYFVVFDDQRYDLKFLYYCLNCLNLTSLAKGVKPGINRNDVYALEAVFPPLSEQKRIVAILDEAFVGIDAAVANTEKNLANTRELFESHLNGVFTRKGDGWVESSLGESCEFFNGKAHEKQIDENGKYIVINSKFISSNGSSFKKTDKALFPLLKSDIVMVMSDVPKGKALAKCFLVDTDDLYSLNQRICCIRSDKFDKRFLYYHLNRHPYLLSFDNKENQTNLRKGDILKCPLWIPDLEEQRLIASRLDDLRIYTSSIESIYQQKLTALAELKQSILQKAFAGELTTMPEKEIEEAVA